MRDLAVVVVAYHGAAMLDTCLAAVGGVAPVVVVDNSSDADVAAVAAEHGADYIDAGGNLGFAAGVNLGLRRVTVGADVLLLNPDAVLSADALTTLHQRLHLPDAKDVAALSPRLVHPVTGADQRVRWPFPTPGLMWREALGILRLVPPPPGFCVGAVLLLRAEALAQVGPFDERFFLYYEETDWQRRAAAAGWRAAEERDVVAEHEGAGTSADLARREVLFHAGAETYCRKWFGAAGWATYRAAALTGASVRGLLLPGPRGESARARALLYLRGPRRVAGLPARVPAAGRRITHVVVTEAFAGVERYVCEVAREQASGGSVVTVVGGDPARMPAELGRARHRPAAGVWSSVRQLMRIGRQDVVHAHMTAAEFAAVLSEPWHHAAIVATRHFGRGRGSSAPARALGRIARSRLARQISISNYVAGAIGEPSEVVPNAVRSQPAVPGARQPVVLCLQRLEPEKATDLAVRAWAASGAASAGWQLHIAGTGSQRADLEELAHLLGIDGSVRFLGQVDDTVPRLRSASLLLATGTADGFGLSVAEAMAQGTPVLASDGGAHPELLGPEGWTFAAGDAGAAADALRRVIQLPPEERERYGAHLRDRQRALFDLDRHVAHLDDLYGALTDGK